MRWRLHFWTRLSLNMLGFSGLADSGLASPDAACCHGDGVFVRSITPLPAGASGGSVRPGDNEARQSGSEGTELVSNFPGKSYRLSVDGLYNGSGPEFGILNPGLLEQKYVSFDAEAETGAIVKAGLSARFTDLQRDPAEQLLNLIPLTGSESEGRSLAHLSAWFSLYGDRISYSVNRRATELRPGGASRRDFTGSFEQHRLNAVLWRSGKSGVSVEAVVSRAEPDYRDLSDKHVTDPLQARNKSTRQLTSNATLGRAGVFVRERRAATLRAETIGGSRPSQTEREIGASLWIADLRDGADNVFGRINRLWAPDMLWVSGAHGALDEGAVSVAGRKQIQKSAIGASRSWEMGTVYVSNWRSVMESPSAAPGISRWQGNGWDVGADLYYRDWSLSGAVSDYRSDTAAPWSNASEDSVSGSIFLTWRPAHGPDVSIGTGNYQYHGEFFDYLGAEMSNYRHYQASFDFSKPASAWLARDVQVKMAVSLQSSANRSQWWGADHAEGDGKIFTGIKFVLPIGP